MFLYHGTSERTWDKIKQAGALLPRNVTKRDNWKHSVSSHPNCVYLTDVYSGYFAIQALEDDFNQEEDARIAIIEIDSSVIVSNLLPDEDMLEQSTRIGRSSNHRMRERTTYFRSKLHTFRGTNKWKESLDYMGTCAHYGEIPLSAVKRVVLVGIRTTPVHSLWAWNFMDPSISHLNYKYCREKYQLLTEEAFNLGEVIKMS